MRFVTDENGRATLLALLRTTLLEVRLDILLCVAAIGVLGIFASYTVPLLTEALSNYSSSSDSHKRITISSVTHLTLATENRSQLVDFLKETTRLPQIPGVAIFDSENNIVVSAWRGEERTFDASAEAGTWVHWPVHDGTQITAYVSAVFNELASVSLVRQLIHLTAIAVAGLMLLLLLGYRISQASSAKRIMALNRATICIANGDCSIRIAPTGTDPIAKLGRAFDQMAEELARYRAKSRATEKALALEKDRALVTLHSIADGVITTDKNARINYMNPTAERLAGLTAEYAKGIDLLTVFDVLDITRRSVRTEVLNRALEHGETGRFAEQAMLRNARGELYFIEESVAPLRDKNNKISGIVAVFHNVTERRALKDKLEREREQALVTLNSIGDGVITTDETQRVVYMNSAAEQLTGYLRIQAQNRPIGEIVTMLDEFGASPTDELTEVGLDDGQRTINLHDTVLLSRTGEKYVVERNAAPLRDHDRRVIGSVLVFHNVTDRQKLIQQLSHQARHDPLTQLINRYEFERHLEQAVTVAARDESIHHVICYMDLDQFKVVNDTCGHSAGDELLRQIAALLKSHGRKGDTLARLGGDEFGLLLPSCSLERALELAEKIRRSVEDFRFVWHDRSFSIGVSIGVLPITGDTTVLTKIFSAVDEACYIAKHKGRNQVHLYQLEDRESFHWHSQIQWVPHIRQALDESRFVLFAQPIVPVDPKREEKEHYEILLRMKDNRGRIVGPGSFLPAAERYGLMPILDRWVVDNAIEALSTAWHQGESLHIDTFGINISGAALSDDNFLDYIKSALDSHGLPPELLCFEITETLAIANFSLAGHFVRELKNLGCRFALDDFGSGFASFSNLKALPVDYLKIDGSFVRHMLGKPVDYAMAEVINRLGHIMGLQTIAEFVESQEILEALRTVGVDYAQGYYVGKPQPLYEVCYSDGALAESGN